MIYQISIHEVPTQTSISYIYISINQITINLHIIIINKQNILKENQTLIGTAAVILVADNFYFGGKISAKIIGDQKYYWQAKFSRR